MQTTKDTAMKSRLCSLIASAGLFLPAVAQSIDLARTPLQAVNVACGVAEVRGRSVVRVTKDPAITAFDEPTFVRMGGPEFRNGTIEVEVLSRLMPDAPSLARGFIGIAFRISADNSRFESLYIRPTNGRAEDQLRRNRATQYFSYPDFKFDRLRQEAPGRYESYADMALDEWIAIRIEVQGPKAEMYLNGGAQPVLVVTDLKHGAEASGAIGLWVDVGTEGYFSNLRVRRR